MQQARQWSGFAVAAVLAERALFRLCHQGLLYIGPAKRQEQAQVWRVRLREGRREREREQGRDTVTGQAGLQTGEIVALTSNISHVQGGVGQKEQRAAGDGAGACVEGEDFMSQTVRS